MQYPHKPGGGDAIGSGYLYRGKNIPELRGKLTCSRISRPGRLWYVDYQELLKADDGKPDTLAPMHEIHLRWTIRTMRPMRAGTPTTRCTIAMAAYHCAWRQRSRSARPRHGVGRRPRRCALRRRCGRRALHLQQERRHDQNRQNAPTVMFVRLAAPLPANVRKPVTAGPVSDDAATAVNPIDNTGSVELLLN